MIDNGTSNAFNGIIDDLRIYNSAVPFVPVSITTVTGSLSYVPGVVGLNAANFVNTPGGSATNYIRGACSPGANFSASLWFNLQSYPDISSNSTKIMTLGSTADGNFSIDVTSAGALRIMTYRTGGISDTYTVSTISINTWYHLSLIHI